MIGRLADLPQDTVLPGVDTVDQVMSHPWAPATLDAFRARGFRAPGRAAGRVHHSTLRARLGTITEAAGLIPDGTGHNRLGLAYLVWRLRNQRVLDLPAPACPGFRTS